MVEDPVNGMAARISTAWISAVLLSVVIVTVIVTAGFHYVTAVTAASFLSSLLGSASVVWANSYAKGETNE